MITRERVAELLEYDGEKLVWRVSRGTKKKGSFAGSKHTNHSGNVYLHIGIDGTVYRVHRLIWLLHYGEWPKQCIDHIDGDGLNNRIENLRDVSNADNKKNQRKPVTNTSGVVGVYWENSHKKWRARISVGNIEVKLGSFTNKSDAIAARKAAEAEYGFHPNHGRELPCTKTSSKTESSTAILT